MNTPMLTDFDLHLLAEGRHFRTYEKLGAHLAERDGQRGARFAVWAPNAQRVSVIGDFNDWTAGRNAMNAVGSAGIWECFIAGVSPGALYKYHIESRVNGFTVDKADPYAFASALRPDTTSKVCDLSTYQWGDSAWLDGRRNTDPLAAPMCVYELHLGSWMRAAGNRWLTYRELATQLADYAHDMGYTHVEFMPIAEHPFDGSWGYQTSGYYAATSRFGEPQDLMFLIDSLHQRGIGVLLDWVPAHFPRDEHGLAFFDGTHLYEHADPRQGEQRDWGTFIFNWGRNEVANFLLSNALFWLDKYHIDGLRVDAVASMLYLDYSRKEGEWIPNRFGGRENLEAIDFLRTFNELVYAEHPGAVTIAEESTSWPMVSKPTYLGGLGFGFKWDMGWMHDTLDYLRHETIHRKYHHNALTFRMIYAFSENFMLPLSHDEVVHGKASLLAKMPGDEWQQFANLRLLFGSMYMQPGKKLLFMGDDIAQRREWNHDQSLDWHLLELPTHRGLQRWVRDLNTLYRGEPALHVKDCIPDGFEWIDCNDAEGSTLGFLRQAGPPHQTVVVALNYTPVPRHNYRLGLPHGGHWNEVLNSDAELYGGSGQGNIGGVDAVPIPLHGRSHSMTITLPPLAMVVFRG